MKRELIALVALVCATPPAWAQGDDDEAAAADDEETVEVADEAEGEDEVVVDDKPAAEIKKQDLRGHDVSATTATNKFEKDRFFVDKVDTKKTRKATLIQGSFTSSTFAYTEGGGDLVPGTPAAGTNHSPFSRFYTDLRLQTDFRHIGGSRWDARVDVRARVVNTPDNDINRVGAGTSEANTVQSGFIGKNEYEIRELFVVHSGKRSDVVLGRQFIADLGAVKIDGLRIDYAKSEALTLVTFGGLYPLRGSRSLQTDYIQLKDNELNSAGRLVGAAGAGGAYRTTTAHGAIGGVALIPFSSESPRVYATSNGYYRTQSQLDLYHFAIVDLVGSAGFALTNLSAGLNYRPGQRLRVNAAFHRVDTETLNVQANAFLNQEVPANAGGAMLGPIAQNEAQLLRIASNAARASVSAGLGSMQRFELTTQVAYRFRPQVAFTTADGMTQVAFRAAKGVELYASLMDRRSFANLRLGVDGLRTIAVGNVAFQRSEVLAVRLFAARDFKQGRGEWEGEVSYSTTNDKAAGTACLPTTPMMPFNADSCFGTSAGKRIAVGGNVFYRINRDWFALGSLFVARLTLDHLDLAQAPVTDPPITAVTGFFRLAYRF